MNASEPYACAVLFLSLPLAVGSSMIIAGVLWALHPMAGIGAGLMAWKGSVHLDEFDVEPA